MAAAYAALNSIMYILQQIQNHPRPPITIENQHMDSLCEIISYLQDFLEKHSHRDIGDIKEALESQIANAAYAAEDVIETHIVDQILGISNFQEENNFIDLFCRGVRKMIRTIPCSRSHKTDHQIRTGDRERSSSILFCQDLQKVINDMNLIKKEVMEFQEKVMGINDDQLPRSIISMSSIIGSSTVPPPKRKNTKNMVGFDDVLIQIMDRLTGHPPNRQVLPIVGMGGIGKTTLARNAYNHPTIVQHFHFHIWITISQEYKLREILLEALSCHRNAENKSSEDELGDQLYKSLCGRRYLIILDDMWSIEAWENLMMFFPDNNNGSRIIITTRLSNVAKYFGSSGFKMNFLDKDKSWELLCKIVFPEDQCCPLELEEMGKKIARGCKGLPLSIVVIAGLLANSERTLAQWEYTAKNLNLLVNLEDDQHCLKILFMSYNHLPVHLKPCFLYMGVYPEDKMIDVPQMINLWVNEGFLKPIKGKTLEMAAREYFNELIDRNLILVQKLGSIGRVKYCKIHDLLRDLCVREGEKDKFLWVRTEHDLENLQDIQSQRRISIHKSSSQKGYHIDRVLEALSSASLNRSLICNFKDVLSSNSSRLVRVLKLAYRDPFEYSPENNFKLVNLRLLESFGLRNSYSVISSIHQLWNLQTLIVDRLNEGKINSSTEFWKMSQLRHVDFKFGYLLRPPNVSLTHEGGGDEFILGNLHTLRGTKNFKFSEEMIKRIPNIEKLGVYYDDLSAHWGHNYCLNNLGHLNKLESLRLRFGYTSEQGSHRIEMIQNLAFPHSLKKLTLYGTHLHWKDMRMIGSLPHLQVLKLKDKSFHGPKWNPVEGEFLCLKFLHIEACDDLVHWNANNTHFPLLEHLVLFLLNKLEEIPWGIRQLPTLRSVIVFHCSDSATMSVRNLLNEQVELGNEDFELIEVNGKASRA